MKTLYIDVYFLINFTVDLLSLYFAAMLSKVNSTARRLIFSSAIGAVFACIAALYEFKGILFIVFLLSSALLMSLIFCKNSTAFRKFKLFAAFLVFETFIGGLVNFSYSVFDKYLSGIFATNSLGAENRQILLVSLLLLLSYGILRILFIVFYNSLISTSTRCGSRL